MTARVFSIVAYIIAGFFVYMVAVLAFGVMPSAAIKAVMMCGFSIPGIIALWVGFAFDRFNHKLRDAGIVLLSGAGLTVFIIFTYACIMATDDFKKMMKPEAMAFFHDYTCGFGFLSATIVSGLLFLRLGIKKPAQPPEPASATAH